MLVSALKSCNSSQFRYKFDEVPDFLRNNFLGQDYYTVTAYFKYPGRITIIYLLKDSQHFNEN